MHLPGNIAAFAVTLLIGVLSFTALGVAMSTFIPNADSSGPLISTVFFVLLFVSGFWFPIQSGTTLANVAAWFPVRHFITAVFASFGTHGNPWAWPDLQFAHLQDWPGDKPGALNYGLRELADERAENVGGGGLLARASFPRVVPDMLVAHGLGVVAGTCHVRQRRVASCHVRKRQEAGW